MKNQGIENGEDVLAVGEDAGHHSLIPGVAQGEALPAFQDFGRDVNISAQFFHRVSAQEEAVEKRRLVLWFRQVVIHQLRHKKLRPTRILKRVSPLQKEFYRECP